MPDHTPGPWLIIYRGLTSREIGSNAYVCHAEAYGYNGREAEANANLIAAAPDLLEALEAQTNWFIATQLPILTLGEQKIWWTEIGNPSQNAISKAKGGHHGYREEETRKAS